MKRNPATLAYEAPWKRTDEITFERAAKKFVKENSTQKKARKTLSEITGPLSKRNRDKL